MKKIPANGRKQPSYWEKVSELDGIPNDNGNDGSDGCFDLDTLKIEKEKKRKSSVNLVQLNILCFYRYSKISFS